MRESNKRGSKIERARDMALDLHEGQMYGRDPYSIHLEDVTGILIRFGHGADEDLMSAGWLHDSLEDTRASYEDIERNLGPRVAELVRAVTDDPEGEDRAARKALPMQVIPTVPGAVILKLADRIANVKRARAALEGSRYIKMYRREQASFLGALHREGEANAMWGTLEMLLEVPDEMDG
jgi:(p)ppGpp synthase/HD superfamily hydrolase